MNAWWAIIKRRAPQQPLDTSLAVESFFRSGSRLVMAVCGVLLLVSVFLPWMTASAKLGAQYSSASGMDISAIMGVTVLICGLVAAATAVLFSKSINKIVQIIIGFIALGAVVFVIATSRLPLLSELGRALIVVSAGFYLCVIAGVILLATGILVRR